MGSLDVHPAGPRDLALAEELDAATRAETGHEAFGETVWRDLHADPPRGLALVADDDAGQAVGLAHLLPPGTDANVATEAALAVAPGAGPAPIRALLDAVPLEAGSLGPADVVLWLPGAGPATGELARAAGWALQRSLHQLRVPLPLDESPVWPDGVTPRRFVPGHDEDAWVKVNNRAFAGHPEQGGWTRDTLLAREREPWFDPAGIVTAWRGDRLLGSCWTKVHGAHGAEHLGEIYVIGVDPDAHGTGLGRALVVAGLAHLAERAVPTGMLFVHDANAPAMRLYTSLGFRTHRTDHAYVHPSVPPSSP